MRFGLKLKESYLIKEVEFFKVQLFFAVNYFVGSEVKMARIIENQNRGRRIIKLSTLDILSVVREYQQIVGQKRHIEDISLLLEDRVIFIPES